jgi:hypothetical protein
VQQLKAPMGGRRALVLALVAAVAPSACGSSGNAPTQGTEAGVVARDGGDARHDASGDAIEESDANGDVAPDRDSNGDAAPDRDSNGDAAEVSTEVCGGFVMPNPSSAGLPNPAVYVVNGDGTITEKVSGLTWQGAVDTMRYSYEDAATYCAAKGAGWRLPTRIELVSLVDYTVGAPGPTINAVFTSTPPDEFWTSTLYYGNDGDAWAVGFDVGYSDYGVRNNPDLVRCVLPPAVTCLPARYQIEAGGLVHDLTTGLTWQQTIDGVQYTWADATAHCAALGGGWRLPSIAELQTIVDDKKEYPAADLDVFPDTPHDDFWSASPDASGAGAAWYVDFFYGATDLDVPTRVFYVRCVL